MWSTGRSADEKFSWQLAPGGKPRSQSFDAGDMTAIPPSHRRHRMQYLANRSLFEGKTPTRPTQPPPLPPPLLSKPPPTKQESFTHFAEELLSTQEIYPANCSLPPLQIVEEPICIKRQVYKTSSNVVDNIDLWQPNWLDMERMGTEKKVTIKRSSSDAVKFSSYKQRDEYQSRMGKKDSATSKYPMAKTVRDLAHAYQAAAAEKNKPPMLARRSSMSSMPVKVLARRFSIPNE